MIKLRFRLNNENSKEILFQLINLQYNRIYIRIKNVAIKWEQTIKYKRIR